MNIMGRHQHNTRGRHGDGCNAFRMDTLLAISSDELIGLVRIDRVRDVLVSQCAESSMIGKFVFRKSRAGVCVGQVRSDAFSESAEVAD
jgi:hypothetical protein